jgi:hypothetical protein
VSSLAVRAGGRRCGRYAPDVTVVRDAQFGARAGVQFAEGFIVREPVLRPNLLKPWPAHGGGTLTP